MRVGGVLQRKGLPRFARELPGAHQIEHLGRHRRQVLALRRVRRERRSRRIQRALLRQQQNVERRDGPGRVAEAHPHTTRCEAVERRRKRVLADAVKDDRHALAAGQRLDPLNEVLAGVDDRVRAAVRLRERRLLVRAHRADHRDAKRASPLAGDEADAAGGGMEQDRLASREPTRLPKQVLDRESLQHQRCGRAVGNAIGQLDQAVRRHHA